MREDKHFQALGCEVELVSKDVFLGDKLKVFYCENCGYLESYRESARQRQRKHIAAKLQNQRILKISFHTFRHYKGTMEYARTKDILHVMQVLGHKNIKNTLIYTQLIDFKDDEFVAKVAQSEAEVCQLIEGGFEYVCNFEPHKMFRKRK